MVLKFREIPISVWQAVREKWEGVLENGWDEDTTWNRCAMCDFIDGIATDEWHACCICPLDTAWCGGAAWLYQPKYANNTSEWEQNVARFIRLCDKIISKLSNSPSEEVVS